MGVFGHKRKQQEVLWRYSKTRICIAIYDHYRGRYRHSYRFYIYYNVHIYIMSRIFIWVIRDRPFNLKGGLWFFVSFRNFFSDNTRVIILFFLSREAQFFFFQNLTLGYMTKTLNQIIFFPPPKSEYFFHQHWESEYFFRKKT